MSELVRENEIVKAVQSKFGDALTESKIPRPRRVYLTLKKEALINAMSFLKEEFNGGHVSTITGLESEDAFEVIYHMEAWKQDSGEVNINVRVKLPKDNPSVPSITKVIPGAVLYEREVHDLVGINFEGHPGLTRLILPDDWPDDVYPLQKQYDLPELKKLYAEKRK